MRDSRMLEAFLAGQSSIAEDLVFPSQAGTVLCRLIQNSGRIHSLSIAFRSWEWDIASPDLLPVQVSDRFTSARMDVSAMRNSRARPLKRLAAHPKRSMSCAHSPALSC